MVEFSGTKNEGYQNIAVRRIRARGNATDIVLYMQYFAADDPTQVICLR
jgi:hypothetical protein